MGGSFRGSEQLITVRAKRVKESSKKLSTFTRSWVWACNNASILRGRGLCRRLVANINSPLFRGYIHPLYRSRFLGCHGRCVIHEDARALIAPTNMTVSSTISAFWLGRVALDRVLVSPSSGRSAWLLSMNTNFNLPCPACETCVGSSSHVDHFGFPSIILFCGVCGILGGENEVAGLPPTWGKGSKRGLSRALVGRY